MPRRSLVSRWRLDERMGGSVGRHAIRRGRFFDPAPWAILTATVVWLLAIYRMTPCIQTDATKGVDPYQRLCYSDLPAIYRSTGMATGRPLLSSLDITGSPLVVALMAFCRGVVKLFGGPVSPDATPQQMLGTANAYWAVASVVLFCAFLGTVVATMLMGRGSDAYRRRSWDAFFVAASPALFMSGLVDFTLVPVALVMLSMLAWARRRPVLSGILIGLACAATLQAGLVVFAVVVLCLRATKLPELSRYVASLVAAIAVCNIIAAAMSPSQWWHTFRGTYWSGTGLGTVWFIVRDLTGQIVPWVGWFAGALTAAGLLALAWFSLTLPRRPRMAQVACVALLIFFISSKVYSPQFVLLLVPLCVLARPDWRDWTVITVTETLYACAVWAHLGGLTLPGGADADVVYWAAIVLRIAGEVWFGWGVLDDMRRPWVDLIRTGHTDDPIGGVLDHAPDGTDEPPGLAS